MAWTFWRRPGRDLACQELVELVSDYLDDQLDRPTRRRVERHLAACDGCDRYVDQMRVTQGLLGTVPLDSVDPQGKDLLVAAFRDYRG